MDEDEGDDDDDDGGGGGGGGDDVIRSLELPAIRYSFTMFIQCSVV